ncbi:hypothetical protein [Pseudoxanthomonas composti]|uniref:Uncharacterized protein n=1 Tax=Pseudoxanthomonas composti TaxID=2137479 RepID=A0A4Q1JVP6_9GAMM|nr:hypothetical protein [Pseudoxanthomonas composti]RXR06333.1 hypothetical protein EPA99_06650 [Pseudoxanthomonas composti]
MSPWHYRKLRAFFTAERFHKLTPAQARRTLVLLVPDYRTAEERPVLTDVFGVRWFTGPERALADALWRHVEGRLPRVESMQSRRWQPVEGGQGLWAVDAGAMDGVLPADIPALVPRMT